MFFAVLPVGVDVPHHHVAADPLQGPVCGVGHIEVGFVAHVVHQQRHGLLKLHFASNVHKAGPQPIHDGGVFVAVLAVQEAKHHLRLIAVAGQRLHDPV